MFNAGHAIRVSGLTYRQLDHIVRNGHVRHTPQSGCGRGNLRRFSVQTLLALRLAKEILGAGHRLGPFTHILKYAQRGRGMPSLDKLEGKVLISNGREVRVVDSARMNLSRTLEARSVIYVVDVGAAARHVRHRIERATKAEK